MFSCVLKNMARPKRYNRISNDVRKRIIRAFEQGENWRMVAEMNGVNYRTAYNWLTSGNLSYEQKTRGANRKRILNESEVDCLLEWIAADPTVTLEFLQSRVKVEYDKEVSTSTISRRLDGRFITLKKLCHIPISMNSLENQERRTHFVYQLLECYHAGKRICWIDETNFNLFCTRTMGRSLKGTKASIPVMNSRGRNLHLIGSMTEDGVVVFNTRRGSFSSDDCKAWVRTLLERMREQYDVRSIVLVCDNAPCHSGLEAVFQEPAFEGAQILRLAPYSPMLNPIENVWSVVKTTVKRQLREQHHTLVAGNPNSQLTQGEWRMQLLEQIVQSAVNGFPNEYCAGFVREVQRNCMKALEGSSLGI